MESKSHWVKILGIFSLLLGSSAIPQWTVAAETIFVNVTLVPMTDNVAYAGYHLVVSGDRIIALGPSDKIAIPKNATVIDGKGKYLMPGFGEMHGHLPSAASGAQQAEKVLFLYAANGLTTVRGMQGAAGQFELRKKVMDGKLIGPTLYLAGPSLNGRRVKSPEQAAKLVREQKLAGWDSLKVHEGLTVAAYSALSKTANEVGIRFGGHVPNDVGVFAALEKGQHTIDHIDNFLDDLQAVNKPITKAQLQRAVTATKAAGTGIVPTQALWKILYNQADIDTLKNYAELVYMPKSQVDSWVQRASRTSNNAIFRNTGDRAIRIANRDKLLQAFAEGGVPILFGTDAPQVFSVPGFSVHREIEAMRQAGLSDYTILRSGTVNIGTYYADYDRFGTLEVGSRADLILLNSNPLTDARRIKDLAGVMLRGGWLSNNTIEQRLAKIATSYR